MTNRLLAIALALAALTAASAAQARQESTPPIPETAMLDDPCAGRAATVYSPGTDWAWLCRYHAANQALAGKAVDVVLIGDSITEGWANQDPGFFVGGIVGRGISGQTSPQLLVRFWQDVVALRPKVVHIMIGTNDIAGNTGPTSPEAYKNAIRAMVTLAKANHIVVILGSIPPADRFSWAPQHRPAPTVAALNLWLKDYAAAEGLVYADYHSALAGPNGEFPPALAPDGVHPNEAGYAAMRPIAERALAEAQVLVGHHHRHQCHRSK
ncbi:MAG: GDSL family lipase [Novosphingobium sp.]|nr:GDSL family lipase [Novosphingobium sp.]